MRQEREPAPQGIIQFEEWSIESIGPSIGKLSLTLFEWIHFRRVRLQMFELQAVVRGLLFEVLGNEIRCVVRYDGQLRTELLLE